MNIHEHQAKELLGRHGVPVQTGRVAFTPEQATENAHRMIQEGSTLLVIKSQIHAGGRGKGIVHNPVTNAPIVYDGKELRGVKVVPTDQGDPLDSVYQIADRILGNKLVTVQTGPEGKIVHRLLIADGVDIDREFYCSILLDRSSGQNLIMVSTEGGVEIEKVAAETPERIFREHVDPGQGLLPFQSRRMAFALGLQGKAHKSFITFIHALYRAYVDTDASLVEVNPLALTKDGDILAVDAKVSIDDNALYRHPDVAQMRDESEEDPLEVEAGKHDLNYIKLDGNVGCMVNGAGLAMATMDIIKLAGGEPANFLDVGGGASVERVANAFRVMMSDPNVKAVLINIFGGIVRCDRVANGIVQAMKTVDVTVPVIVRLDGTNAEEARKALLDSDLDFSVAGTLKEAAEKVNEAIAGVTSSVVNLAMASASMSTPQQDRDDDELLDDDDKDENDEAGEDEDDDAEEFEAEEVDDPDVLELEGLDDDLDEIDDLDDVFDDEEDEF